MLIPLSRCPFSEEALRRGIIGRTTTAISSFPPGYRVNKPSLIQSGVMFEHSKEKVSEDNTGVKIVPCSAGQYSLLFVTNVGTPGKQLGIQESLCPSKCSSAGVSIL